ATEPDTRPVISPPDAIALYLRKNGLPSLVSGLGGALAIWLLATLTQSLDHLLLIAPFGASCVLLFALPASPLARPRNLVGGHCSTGMMGSLALTALVGGVLSMSVGVGLGIAAMQFTGTLHPPAGGNPLVVIMTGAGWSLLVLPVLAGTLSLLAMAYLY